MTNLKAYVNFDLHIESVENKYRARVLDSPAGPATSEFSLPFSDDKLENFILRISQGRRRVRKLKPVDVDVSREFGTALFDAIFAGEIEFCLRNSITAINPRTQSLRLRLRLSDAPELVDIPWEYLYDATNRRFLALSVDTPLVRYLDLSGSIKPLAVQSPLRVLVVISSPADVVELDVEEEWTKLKGAVADLEEAGLIRLERLAKATLDELQRQLRRSQYHIFHFIGHGGFDHATNTGALMMEDENGRGRLISGQTLGTLLHDEKTLRLAVLNACEGGRTSKSDPFAGVGQTLLMQGVPAVIAMQFEVTDASAIALTSSFYAAVTDGYPVEAALTEARKSIFARDELEWGTPVLYMRTTNGQIFELPPIAERITPPVERTNPIADEATPKVALPEMVNPLPASVKPIQGNVSPTQRTDTPSVPIKPSKVRRAIVSALVGGFAMLVILVGLVLMIPDDETLSSEPELTLPTAASSNADNAKSSLVVSESSDALTVEEGSALLDDEESASPLVAQDGLSTATETTNASDQSAEAAPDEAARDEVASTEPSAIEPESLFPAAANMLWQYTGDVDGDEYVLETTAAVITINDSQLPEGGWEHYLFDTYVLDGSEEPIASTSYYWDEDILYVDDEWDLLGTYIDYEPDLELLWLPMVEGEYWEWSGTVDDEMTREGSATMAVMGTETVETVVGPLETFHLQVTLMLEEAGEPVLLREQDLWLAKGYGIVRQYTSYPMDESAPEFDWQLSYFER